MKVRDLGAGLALATVFSLANAFHSNDLLKDQVAEAARLSTNCAPGERQVTDWLGNKVAFQVAKCEVAQHPTDPNGACVKFSYSRPNWTGPAHASACAPRV